MIEGSTTHLYIYSKISKPFLIMGHYEDPYSPTSIMECHVRILITVHMCCCPELVVQSERYPIDRLNIAINHHESRFVQPRTMHVRGIFL